MCRPKKIEDVSISDLERHRWCYYHNDDFGFDAFEHVVPDTHPEFSSDTIELELAQFSFANGKIFQGMYDGSESFTLILGNESISFWRGMARPSSSELQAIAKLLADYGLIMPVKVVSKWSKYEKVFNGLEYLNEQNKVVSLAI